MSTTITVNEIARSYQSAFDDEYKKALDAGNTKLGKASVKVADSAGALTIPATSHLVKSVSAAGKGQRATISLKDRIHVNGVDTDETVSISFYFPKGDPMSAARLASKLKGLSDRIMADDGVMIQELVLGVIELT